MTPQLWAFVGIAAVPIIVLGWALCGIAGKLDQNEEDRYGTHQARRS